MSITVNPDGNGNHSMMYFSNVMVSMLQKDICFMSMDYVFGIAFNDAQGISSMPLHINRSESILLYGTRQNNKILIFN